MTTKEKRLNFRTTETVESKLFAAAQASNESLTDFVLNAASRRADDVLATRTPVPSDYFDHLLCEAAGHFAVGSGHEQGAEGIAEVFARFASAAELFAVLPGALEGGAGADLGSDVCFQFGEVAVFCLVEGHVVEGALDLEGIVLFCHFGDILMFDKKGTVGRPNYFE